MSATADRPAASADVQTQPLARVEGLELLGEVSGSGYKQGAALVRRADGQMVQLGPLMFTLLEEIDGQKDNAELAGRDVPATRARLRGGARRRAGREARRAGAAGRLGGERPREAQPAAGPALEGAGHRPEGHQADHRTLRAPLPPVAARAACSWASPSSSGSCSSTRASRRPPRRRSTAPSCCCSSSASASPPRASTRSATPSACRYGGGRPGGMGAGIYMVWPAFYTDVTDAYRLAPARPAADRPRRALLQRRRRGRHARRLAGRARRRAAAGDRAAAAGDGQAALAGHPRRRLPHPLRRDRRSRTCTRTSARRSSGCCPGTRPGTSPRP